MNDTPETIEIKPGSMLLLTDDVKGAIDNPFIRHLAQVGDELRVDSVYYDGMVLFKAVWYYLPLCSCTMEQAQTMRKAWLDKDYPALRTGANDTAVQS